MASQFGCDKCESEVCVMTANNGPPTIGVPTGGECGGHPKCNAPVAYVTMSIDSQGTAPQYFKTPGFSSSWESAIKSGVEAARAFLGSASETNIFLWGPNEDDANYKLIAQAHCDRMQPDDLKRGPGCLTNMKDQAKNFRHPAYMLGGPLPKCTCGAYSYTGALVHFRPNPSDKANDLWAIAAHEYTHAVQRAFGGPMPAWLMEGGAVQMQCLLGTIRPGEFGGPVSYSDCFKFGGGRAPGIIRNVVTVYARKQERWLSSYGNDRACGTQEVPPYQAENPLPIDRAFMGGSALYYDVGALAVAFAINRSGKSSLEFWTGPQGFWHNVQPYGSVDLQTGWESDVPEGQGWRKALADFTGFTTSKEFFDSFETWIRPAGIVIPQAEMLAILEDDSKVAGYAATVASFPRRGPSDKC